MLQALNLIEKTSLMNRKPGFRWLGSAGFQAFMDGHRTPTQSHVDAKVFVVSRPQPEEQQCRSPQELPRAKHFAPRILQSASAKRVPFAQAEDSVFSTRKRRLDSPENAVGKENVNTVNQTRVTIGKSGCAFTKLNVLLEVVGKMGHKVQVKALRKRPMMVSQETNMEP